AAAQIVGVDAAPAEGLAAGALEAAEVDAARRQERHVLLGEIIADDADEVHLIGQVRGGDADVRRGAAEELGAAAARPIDVIEGDRADDEQAMHGSYASFPISYPMMSSRRRRASASMCAGSVMTAERAAVGHGQVRGGRTTSTARRTMSRAVATLRPTTAST